MKKAFVSFVVSAALVMAPLPAMTQSAQNTGPMPAGGAAGVKPAQDSGPNVPWWWLIGGGAAIGLGVLLLTNNDNNKSQANPPTPSPTTAPQTSGTGT